jgi:hypothetical protein
VLRLVRVKPKPKDAPSTARPGVDVDGEPALAGAE